MTSVGIRVSPSAVYFTKAEFDGNETNFGNPQELIVPRDALSCPAYLHHVYTNMSDILRRYEVNAVCVKEADFHPNRSVNRQRDRIEGVMEMLMAHSPANHYIAGDVNKLSRYVGLTPDEFRRKKKGENFEPVDDPNWGDYSSSQIESILASLIAIESYGQG